MACDESFTSLIFVVLDHPAPNIRRNNTAYVFSEAERIWLEFTAEATVLWYGVNVDIVIAMYASQVVFAC